MKSKWRQSLKKSRNDSTHERDWETFDWSLLTFNLPENWSWKTLSQAQNVKTLAWITAKNLNVLARVDFGWHWSDRFFNLITKYLEIWISSNDATKRKEKARNVLRTAEWFLPIRRRGKRLCSAQQIESWSNFDLNMGKSILWVYFGADSADWF